MVTETMIQPLIDRFKTDWELGNETRHYFQFMNPYDVILGTDSWVGLHLLWQKYFYFLKQAVARGKRKKHLADQIWKNGRHSLKNRYTFKVLVS